MILGIEFYCHNFLNYNIFKSLSGLMDILGALLLVLVLRIEKF